MRKIKFRVWDKSTNKMYYDSGIVISGNDIVDGFNIPMQFTGLTDKNEVDIYEGDIVTGELCIQSTPDPDRCKIIPFNGVVDFVDGFFYVKSIDGNNVCPFYYPDYTIEVTGSIHENKDLLK